MKTLILAVAILATTACGPRPVEVQNGPKPANEVTLRVTNNLSQDVNVYVVNGGQDLFLKQVAANSTAALSVPGIPAGTTVMLKATPADGSKTYTRDNVTLTTLYDWQVP